MLFPVGTLIGMAAILIGVVLTTIAVAVPYWTLVKNEYTDGENVVQGLFEICFKGKCVTLDSLKTVSIPDDLIICRVTNITGLVLGFLAGLLSLHWLMKARTSSDKKTWQPSLVFLAAFLAASLVTMTLVIYGVQLYHPTNGHARLGYAFYLNAVGAFLLMAGGIIQRVAVAICYMTSYPEQSGDQLPTESSGPMFFYNLQQEEKSSYRGLVYQQPQATVLEPPQAYRDEFQEEHTYVAHLKRDLPQDQYTPGEKRKAAPGSSSI